MAKYIELIDKYRIEQSSDDTDYNPPSYIWADNTGEIVRCEDCKHADDYGQCKYVTWYNDKYDYCSKGKRKADDQT